MLAKVSFSSFQQHVKRSAQREPYFPHEAFTGGKSDSFSLRFGNESLSPGGNKNLSPLEPLLAKLKEVIEGNIKAGTIDSIAPDGSTALTLMAEKLALIPSFHTHLMVQEKASERVEEHLTTFRNQLCELMEKVVDSVALKNLDRAALKAFLDKPIRHHSRLPDASKPMPDLLPGDTAIAAIARFGTPALLQKILAAGASVRHPVSYKASPENVQALWQHIRSQLIYDSSRLPEDNLLQAAKWGDLEAYRALRAQGADVLYMDDEGSTALTMAAEGLSNFPSVKERFIERDSTINLSSQGAGAYIEQYSDLMQEILQDISARFQDNPMGLKAFLNLSLPHHSHVKDEALRQSNISPGQTALFPIVHYGTPELLKQLLSLGAKINIYPAIERVRRNPSGGLDRVPNPQPSVLYHASSYDPAHQNLQILLAHNETLPPEEQINLDYEGMMSMTAEAYAAMGANVYFTTREVPTPSQTPTNIQTHMDEQKHRYELLKEYRAKSARNKVQE